MKRLFWKIGSANLELIGRFSVGDTEIAIAADGDLAIGLVNGYRVVDGNLYEDPLAHIVPPLASIAAKIFRDKWGEGSKIQMFKAEWDSAGKYPSCNFLTSMASALIELLDESNVEVLDKATPPVRAEKPRPKITISVGGLVANLNRYQQQLDAVNTYLDRTLERATVLSRRQLVGTMWGADKVQAIIDRVRVQIPELEETVEDAEQTVPFTLKAVQRISARLSAGALGNPEELKYMGEVLVPSILQSHDSVQKMVASVVAALAPLSTIDRTIRVNTGSPASFFLPTNVLEDFRDAFAILVAFLADVPDIEAGVMDPLEYIKSARMAQKPATTTSQRPA